MRLDRDSKHPIWLGLILIFAAFIFTLFFITRVHASEVQTYGYNNVIIISGTGQRISFCFADGSFGLRFSFNPTDEDDGYNIYTHEEFEQRFNDFFAYVLASQTYIVFYDDYVAKGTYEYLEEYFLSKGCGWVLSDAVFPITFPDSFSLMQGHAGMWFFPYYTRSVPLTPTPSPSPSPTPDPSLETELEFWFMTADGEYYFVDIGYSQVYGSELLSDYPPFVYVRSQYSNYTDLPLLRPAIVETKQSTSNINSYFSGSSVSFVRIYDIGVTYITDSSYIKSSFDYVDVKDASKYNNGYYDIECRLESSNQSSFNLYSFYLRKSNWGQNVVYVGSNIASYSFNSSYNSLNGLDFTSGYESSCPVVYGIELMTNVREDPNLPSPTVTPSPSPSPTEAPHVIINWPSGTPSPTPPFSVPAEDTGGGSGSPGGSSQGSLTPGQVNSTLNTFKQYTQNNGAFAFLYACTGLIPDDALYFLFILLFILLLLACLRLFVHFTGG